MAFHPDAATRISQSSAQEASSMRRNEKRGLVSIIPFTWVALALIV